MQAGRLRFERQTTVICLRGGLSDVFQLSRHEEGGGFVCFKSL